MNERDFDEISRFLTMVGSATLFEYLKLDPTAPPGEVDRAIKERRAWAQGQQANPKYRGEALWIIKNQRSMRDALVDFRAAYLERNLARDQEKNLEVLALFIRGTMSSGNLTAAGERAIFAQGAKLGLSEQMTRTRIQAIASEIGVSARASEPEPFQDHYAALEVARSATSEEIDAAYRARYRWARSLADTNRSRQEYARLDAALRDLKDPARRAAYDAVHSAQFPDIAPITAGAVDAFLPPPADDPPSQPSQPSQAEPSVRSSSLLSGRGPRIGQARTDPFELSEPPGATPPVRAEGTAPAPPPVARPRSTASDPQRSAPPGARTLSAPPGTPEPARDMGSTPSGQVPRPGQVQGRSLDLTSPREGTHLRLDSPDYMLVKTGSGGTTVQIRLTQVGPGTVTGRILADREWVSVEPSRLDTTKKEHVISARIHADRMQRGRGSSVVTIVPSHGARVAVTLEVEKKKPIMLVLMLLLAVAIGGAVAAMKLMAPAEVVPPRMLTVVPDPISGIVFIDDTLIGPGRQQVDLAKVAGGSAELKVTLGGFKDHVETVNIEPGASLTVRPRLELEKSLTAIPASTEEGVALDMRQVNEQLAVHRSIFEECNALPAAPPALKVRAFVSFGGQVEGYLPLDPVDPDPTYMSCVARGMRALQFVLTEPADFYTFEVVLPTSAPK